LVWLYFQERTNLFDASRKKFLHVAPEPPVSQPLRKFSQLDYLSADLGSPFAMEKMDITDIGYPDAHFDVIYCSHVLEHVPDDVKAIREFVRVLKPGGWAILQVPIFGSKTITDPEVKTREDRLRIYGHPDHVRIYGADYKLRLEAAGFDVTVDNFVNTLSKERLTFLGINPDENVYFCRKHVPDA
jgi:SAM-dependent methyltransferase